MSGKCMYNGPSSLRALLDTPWSNFGPADLLLPRITSLRLIQPRIDIQAAAQAALSFEQKAFLKANERVRSPNPCSFFSLRRTQC